jgi:hypothetical protein
MVIIDGGIIVSKAVREPQIMARQILAYRAFVRTVRSSSGRSMVWNSASWRS